MRLSVVIPALDEGRTVARAIGSARAALGECEVLVVDGGSADGTVEAARQAGARVEVAAGTRADAMNAGARAAGGEAFLFLHADTTLPAGAGAAVRDALARADAGAFRLRYDESRRVLHALAAVRERWLAPVYGDQAIFVTRAAFERLGGYRALPIMEDYDLVSRLRRHGSFVLLPLHVETSARRHRRDGTAATLARVWTIQWLYRAGVPPTLLARAYPRVR